MQSQHSKVRKQRFTLWLPVESVHLLEQIQRASGKVALAEVVRDALEVYCSLHRARRAGIELFFTKHPDGKRGQVWLLPGPFPGERG